MRGLVAACAWAALGLGLVRAATVCGPQEFPVSVQSDPTIYCVASRPCSGDYSLLRQIGAVGACPNGAGCALLPQAPNVMGCVKAGLADVSYVNADGSLTRNGAIVAANADTTTTKTTKAVTKEKVETATNGTASGSTASATTLDSTSSKASTSSAAGTSSKASEPADAAAAAASVAVLSPSSTSGSMKSLDVSKASVANQQSVDDINGNGTSKTKNGQASSGGGLGPTVGILVGCLAIVAVVAGVFVLRKAKESGDLETPQEGMNEYGGGNGVMTPRDQVQLL